MQQPLVSILCSVYNGAPYVLKMIESCLNQSYPAIEVCIVDDGSTDHTWQVLSEHFKDHPQIKLARFEKNRGKVAGFNQAYALAQGQYFALIGADDWMYPQRIQHSLALLQQGHYDLVYGKALFCDENLQAIDCAYNKIDMLERYQKLSFEGVLHNNPIGGGLMLFSRAFAEHAFLIPEDLKFEDWWLAFHALRAYKIGFLDEFVTKGVRHGNNATSLGSDKQQARAQWEYFCKRDITYFQHFLKLLKPNEQNYRRIVSLNLLIRSCYMELNFFKRLKFIPMLMKNLSFNKYFIKGAEAIIWGDYRVWRMRNWQQAH